MKDTIVLDITIPNQTRYLGVVGKIGETVVSELNLPQNHRERLCQNINMVLTEALVNAITHANATDPDKEVHIHISASKHELLIKVYDQGKGFTLNLLSPPKCPDPLNEHGRGIFIIRSLMDSVDYQKANGGNVLTMKKSFNRIP